MTRRRCGIMRGLALGFLAALSISAAAQAQAQAQGPEKTRILLIGKDRDHPPDCHEYMDECRLLARSLSRVEGVSAIVSNGWPKDPRALEGVSAIVLYTGNGGDVLFHHDVRAQAEALLNRGVGLVSLHWSTGAAEGPTGEAQLNHLGGWFCFKFSKFLVCESRIRQADPKHPICRGWTDFDFRDEFYTGLKFRPEAKPLLTARIDGADETIAWTYERPNSQQGRSFGLVCGHFHDCFANESFRKMVVNAILWTAKRDVPPQGSDIAVDPEDLKLSPDPRRKPSQGTGASSN